MFIFRNKRVESISPETTFVKAKQEETLGGVLVRKKGQTISDLPPGYCTFENAPLTGALRKLTLKERTFCLGFPSLKAEQS